MKASKNPSRQQRATDWFSRHVILSLMGPIFALMSFILLVPFALEIYLSTTPWQPIIGDWWAAPFIGADNYVTLLTKDFRFLMSLARTALLVTVAISIEFWLGLSFALLISQKIRGRKIFFSILLLPMMIMPIIVGYDMYMLFQAVGPVNYLLSLVSGQNIQWAWLGDDTLAFITLVITDVWHWTPFIFLVLLSGLMALPQNPINAAKVLGASNWQIFWHIKFTMLRKIVLIAVVIRGMELMKFFDELYILTGGGPGFATETLSMFTYLSAIQYSKIGYSSAAAIIILIIAVTLITYAVRPVLRGGRE